ncbi:hypothetical protein D3C78_912250 [compost metagenome]
MIVAQLDVLEQDLPRFIRFGGSHLFLFLGVWLGGGRLGLFFRSGFGRLAGKQLLPVELAICLHCCPGFQLVAADLADSDQLFGQVYRGFADVQAGQPRQWAAIRRLDGKGGDADRSVVEQ